MLTKFTVILFSDKINNIMVRVSVIVPVYKVERYLDICLDSIINQTFEDFEIICVNDGSPDNCLNILRQYSKFDSRIKVFSQKNKGLSAARNTGMKYAKGEYITFVDSDDFLSPVALERMYNNICENHSDYMFSYAYQFWEDKGYYWELSNIKEFKKYITEPVFNETELGAEFYLKLMYSAWAKLYRKDFIQKFSFPEGLIFEDMPFFAQCYLNAKRISYDFEPLYFYRKTQNSIISNAGENFLDIFKINNITKKVFEESGKLEKYKTILLVSQMESVLVRTLETKGAIKRKMFDKIQETYGNIDFTQYDMEILKKKNVFYAYQEILNKDYNTFKRFESRVKNGK